MDAAGFGRRPALAGGFRSLLLGPLVVMPLVVSLLAATPDTRAVNADECLTIDTVSERCPAWIAAYDNPSYGGLFGGSDLARDVAVSPGGDRVFVTGSSWQESADGVPSTGFDIATVAYDAATADELWVSRYDGPRHADDVGRRVVVTREGSTVIVVGTRDVRSPTGAEVVAIAYDATDGTVRWESSYAGPDGAGATPSGITLDPTGGRVYVVGEVGAADRQDLFAMAFDTETGALAWVATYDGPAGGRDSGQDVAVDEHGDRVYVVGWSESGSGEFDRDWIALAYEAGDPQPPIWVSRVDGGPGLDDEAAAVVTSDEGVFVAGQLGHSDDSAGAAPHSDVATIGYDALSGEEMWRDVVEGGPVPLYQQDHARDIVLGSDGVFVSATTSDPVGCGMTTLAYGFDGSPQWSSRYHLPADDCTENVGLAYNPVSDRVLTVGYSVSRARVGIPNGGLIQRSSYVVAEYPAASDELISVTRINSHDLGLDNDQATALALAPDGARLFVTGSFGYQPPQPAIANTWDYGTVALLIDNASVGG